MKHLGQTKARKPALTMGLRIVMMKSVKTLRMTRLRRHILQLALSRSGASNEHTFLTVSQVVFSQRFASVECMYFPKLFANMLSQKY